MKEITGDLFNQTCDAICITTNGFIKKNGECVMGRGCAATAAKKWPTLPLELGKLVQQKGNNVHILPVPNNTFTLISFPVKPSIATYNGTNCVRHMRQRFTINQEIPGWAALANPDIILRSANQLLTLTNHMNWTKVILPRPGCGAGELSWTAVSYALNEILDDRFHAITFK